MQWENTWCNGDGCRISRNEAMRSFCWLFLQSHLSVFGFFCFISFSFVLIVGATDRRIAIWKSSDSLGCSITLFRATRRVCLISVKLSFNFERKVQQNNKRNSEKSLEFGSFPSGVSTKMQIPNAQTRWCTAAAIQEVTSSSSRCIFNDIQMAAGSKTKKGGCSPHALIANWRIRMPTELSGIRIEAWKFFERKCLPALFCTRLPERHVFCCAAHVFSFEFDRSVFLSPNVTTFSASSTERPSIERKTNKPKQKIGFIFWIFPKIDFQLTFN